MTAAVTESWIQTIMQEFGVDPNAADVGVTTADAGKITVFTVAGTGAFNPKTGNANFPAQIAAALDTIKYTWVPVPYPAMIPFSRSVDVGKNNLKSRINSYAGKFALLAYSQGCMVCSPFLDEIISGDLSARNGDFVGAVMMGNPCRKTNATFTGYTVTSGHHGIADSGHRITTSDSRWWEMAIPNDLAADIGDDTAGTWLSTLFMDVWGGTDPAQAVRDTFASSPVDLTNSLGEVLAYFGLEHLAGAAHTKYGTYVPTTISGSPNTKTMMQLATDYINSLS